MVLLCFLDRMVWDKQKLHKLPRVEDPLIRTSSTFGKVPEIPFINGVAIFFT